MFSLIGLLVILLSLSWGGLHRKHRRPRVNLAARPSALAAAGIGNHAATNYEKDIKPILAQRCYSCHSGSRHKAGLRLDTADSIRQGGQSGPAIVPGHAAQSLLIAAVTGEEGAPPMPPTGDPLTPQQIALLQSWIDNGAFAPKNEQPANAAIHWAFLPPVRPTVPNVHHPGWVRNPIDAFIAAEHEKRGLAPCPPADRGLLLRRVYLDLIGLPPTGEELRRFLADPAEDAYERAVDRLLASPLYGERWGRHWMDIWRYSDVDGRKSMNEVWWSSPYIWRWRDWIISSLNQDQGYDKMVVDMLAGDEAAPKDPQALAATGFLARNYLRLNRTVWLNNTVEHTGKAFLGLTLNCARCHDHKFDPISQMEYYQFRAIFEPHEIRVDSSPGSSGKAASGLARAFDAHPDEPTYLLRRGDESNPDKSITIRPGLPGILAGPRWQQKLVEPSPKAGDTGRRLALAHWLVSPQNPLAARVAVNHIWMRHFGKPLVDSVYDFGLRCTPPTHPELLDWLAVEFQEHHWSMKWLHRLIVTSNAYRMASSLRDGPAQDLVVDPENRYLWHMNPHRMEGEVLRDSLLYLAGDMDLTPGGPDLPPDAGETGRRRSLYYKYSREDKLVFLTVFDPANVDECYRRNESVVPQQALAMLNSEFVRAQAQRLASRLARPQPPETGIAAAFEEVLCRPPTPEELAVCEHFLKEQGGLFAYPARLTPLSGESSSGAPPAGEPSTAAWASFVHVLLNHNDFVTIR